jgi:hypothetical protein
MAGVLDLARAAALLSLCDAKMQLRGGRHAWTEHELCAEAAADIAQQQHENRRQGAQ